MTLSPGVGGIVKPYGVRDTGDHRVVIFQAWDFEGEVYDLSMYVVVEDRATGTPTTCVMRTKYYAIGTARLMTLMERAGFTAVERLDGRFYQPVLVGGDRRTWSGGSMTRTILLNSPGSLSPVPDRY